MIKARILYRGGGGGERIDSGTSQRTSRQNIIFFQVAILREVHYLKLMNKENIPEAALNVSEREDTFRNHTSKLNQTIEWYNKIRRVCAPVEFDLIKDVVSSVFLTDLMV